MKLRDFLILMVIFLAVLLVAIICDQYTRHRPNPVPVPPIEDHKPISPEELERQYQDIDRELKEKDKKGDWAHQSWGCVNTTAWEIAA